MAQGRAVSMSDVAAEAGVSLKTVSRVVNEPEKVRPETRERVEEAMDRMGFRANYAGRSLKTGRYQTVGLAMLHLSGGNMAVFDGIASEAAERGYAVTLVKAREGEELTLSEAARRMLPLPVDGMIFNLNRMVEDFQAYRSPAGLPTVIISPVEHPACTTVSDDQEGCTRMATEHLLERGHRRVAYIGGPEWSMAAQARLAGWRAALEARGLESPEPLEGDWTADSGYEAGARLAGDAGCTAVMCANDCMALGAMEALRDAGRRVPEDVSIIGVDDSLEGTVPHVELTSVRFRHRELGARAFDEVLCGVEEPGRRERVLIPGDLVERGSVADLR